jgi:hypothetical protein
MAADAEPDHADALAAALAQMPNCGLEVSECMRPGGLAK